MVLSGAWIREREEFFGRCEVTLEPSVQGVEGGHKAAVPKAPIATERRAAERQAKGKAAKQTENRGVEEPLAAGRTGGSAAESEAVGVARRAGTCVAGDNSRRDAAKSTLAMVEEKENAGREPGASSGAGKVCLSGDAFDLLWKASKEPGKSLTEYYRELGISPRRGRAASKELEALGMVRRHTCPKRGRGGERYLLEVLAAGIEELKRREVVPGEQKVKRGSFLHSVYTERLVERRLRSRSKRVAWDSSCAGKDYDAWGEFSEGGLWAVETVCSGSVAENVESIVRAVQPGIAMLYVVVERLRDLEKLKAGVSERLEDLKRIELVFAGDLWMKENEED